MNGKRWEGGRDDGAGYRLFGRLMGRVWARIGKGGMGGLGKGI